MHAVSEIKRQRDEDDEYNKGDTGVYVSGLLFFLLG
jgi:hypothetical protein